MEQYWAKMLVQIDNQAQSQIKTNNYDLFPAILKDWYNNRLLAMILELKKKKKKGKKNMDSKVIINDQVNI